MSFYPTSYYNTGTGITNIQATDVSAATVEASTAFSGPGTGLTGTATSLTAGLAQNLTGSPAVSVSSLTSTGSVGVGTTNPLANFHIYNPLVSAARVEAPSASGVNPQYQLYASGSQVSLWGYSWNGSYTYFQTNQTQDSMRFYNGAGGAIALQPVSGSVGINTTSPQYTLDVNGTTRISSYVTLPAQPSWSIYFISSLVSSATETNAFTSFNSAATARDVTISSGTVTINTPGRYSVTLTGQVYNDGKVRMYFGRSLGTVLVYNSAVTNSGSAGIASTYIVDCIATQTIYVTLVQNNGTYPLVGYNWSFSGQMIG